MGGFLFRSMGHGGSGNTPPPHEITHHEEVKSALSSMTGVSAPSPVLEIKANIDDIKASDDLVQRARNIVWALGIRGSVGDYVLAVHEILQRYEKADRVASDKPELRIARALDRVERIGGEAS